LSGIFLLGSSNYNILTGNTAYGNTSQGIYLEESNSNLLSHNTCGLNKTSDEGIYLYSSNNNVLTDNNCNSNHWDGIDLSSSNNNIITGNHCNSNSWDGISLYSSNYNIFTDNYCNSNTEQGIYMYNSNNNTVYLNNLSDNPSENAYVESSSGNIWNSPTPIYYDYTSGSFHKNYIGNYYGDYTGSDADGDGIGNTAYSKNGITDNYPLMATSDHYSLEAWWLNSDGKMYIDDRSKAPGRVAINGNSSQIWIDKEALTKDIGYSGDDTWTGQIVFTTAPSSGETFTVEIGSSTDGTDFTSGDLQATIAGNGSKTIFTFETNAKAFNLSSGNYLALKLTNNSGTNYDIQTGGAWSYCSSAKFVNEPPSRNEDNILPNQFSLFQNQPNPFVTSTMIRYELPERSNVSLKVYDLFGREVTTLFEGEQNAGKYEVEFNGTNLPGGIYFYKMSTKGFSETKKLILLK
ncbi:MAG TPA: NosD domain-containing protein, partial [Paludibacteraceae bacterium]|nr:NosD domain-containing protein [Paludibacteraceae bacterium]